jgi:hypothetical protein
MENEMGHNMTMRRKVALILAAIGLLIAVPLVWPRADKLDPRPTAAEPASENWPGLFPEGWEDTPPAPKRAKVQGLVSAASDGGFMGSNIWGIPFAVDRSIDPIIGIGIPSESAGLNTALAVNFRAPNSGNIDYFRSYYLSNSGAPYAGYAGGTGGQIQVRLYEVDSSGVPTGSPLDSFVFYPNLVNGYQPASVAAYQIKQWEKWDFPNNPAVVGGGFYAITLENIDPNPAGNYIRTFFPDFYSASVEGDTGNSYLGTPEGWDRRTWGMRWKRAGGTWQPGNTYGAGTGGQFDPLPVLGVRMTDGSSFGQSGWLVSTEHENFHGIGYPLGSGCTQNGPGSMPCDYGPSRTPKQIFEPATPITIDKILVPLVPYGGGTVTLSIRRMSDSTVVASCTVSTPTLAQTYATSDLAGYIRSRQFQCPVSVTLTAQVYRLEVSSTGATGGVLVLGDATVWPFSTPPMADMAGASAITGSFIDSDGSNYTIYDMQFGFRLGAGTAPATTTTTAPPQPPTLSIPSACSTGTRFTGAQLTPLTTGADLNAGGWRDWTTSADQALNTPTFVATPGMTAVVHYWTPPGGATTRQLYSSSGQVAALSFPTSGAWAQTAPLILSTVGSQYLSVSTPGTARLAVAAIDVCPTGALGGTRVVTLSAYVDSNSNGVRNAGEPQMRRTRWRLFNPVGVQIAGGVLDTPSGTLAVPTEPGWTVKWFPPLPATTATLFTIPTSGAVSISVGGCCLGIAR